MSKSKVKVKLVKVPAKRERSIMYFDIRKGSAVEDALYTVKNNIATTSDAQAFRYALLLAVKHLDSITSDILAQAEAGVGAWDHIQLDVTGDAGLVVRAAIHQLRVRLAQAGGVEAGTITNRTVFETAILFAAKGVANGAG